jgi:type II secretory pathway pseudopilin PulG
MRRGLRSARLQITNHKLQNRQRGYMLITLVLALALITIALLTVLPDIGQQIRRDREDEMRHRGTAYMRAIQHFYKKFGRYPTKIEDLESTNNVRFLRKRYTDPINRDPATGKERDFKLLHQTDISLNNGPVLGQTSGQSSLSGAGGLQGQGGFGGAQSGLGGLGGLGGFGAQPGGLQQATSAGAQTSATGSSGDSSSSSSGSSSSGSSSSGNSSDAGGSSTSSGSSSSSSSTGSGSGLSGQTFGGGPILGVASTSKAKSIRVFYTKNHYNDWLFIYITQADRGGLLVGPINPGAQTGVGGIGGIGGAPGLSGGVTGQGLGQGLGGLGSGGLGSGGQGLGGQGFGLNSGQSQNGPTQTQQTPAPTSPQQ